MRIKEFKQFPCFICTTSVSKRINFALKELKRLGIENITLAEGINASTAEGEHKTLQKCKEYNINSLNFKKYGEIALAIAFIESLKKFLNTEENYMIWFEDDIILHPNYLDVLQNLESFKDWKLNDVTYLGCCWASKEKKPVVNSIKNKKYWFRCDKTRIWGTHAMILSRKMASLLVSSVGTAVPIDRWINNISRLNFPNIIRSSLIFPINFINKQNFVCTTPEIKIKDEIYSKYVQTFHGENTKTHPCWGLVFQRHVSSILKKTKLVS